VWQWLKAAMVALVAMVRLAELLLQEMLSVETPRQQAFTAAVRSMYPTHLFLKMQLTAAWLREGTHWAGPAAAAESAAAAVKLMEALRLALDWAWLVQTQMLA
jgi:hypothetical protein